MENERMKKELEIGKEEQRRKVYKTIIEFLAFKQLSMPKFTSATWSRLAPGYAHIFCIDSKQGLPVDYYMR